MSDIGQTSEREFEKIFRGSHKPTKKCAMKMKKETRKKRHARKNILMEGSGL